ncbi:MAG TPA: UDP-N-acetylmuramoyl-tripeptide--D-alanyl-D-alanine ligase [Elusimicrobiota bacterium]|nr:UDP-N-acetylmuramoyl-tripeptide--D-alanyl-D-alanine ligase [Elusimicrobiota bacterium]
MNLRISWEELAKAAQGRLSFGHSGDPVESISIDSRTLKPSQAFWALKGPRYDGHDFLNSEAARKASGWVVETGRAQKAAAKPEHLIEVRDTGKALLALAADYRRKFEIPVVGVTGSNGKTTTKEMLRSICEKAAPTCTSPGNWNNHIGTPLSVLELQPEHRYAIFELADSKPGDIREIAQVAQPTVAVITNIGPDHMEFYANLEQNFRTKAEILEGLPADGKAVINADDPWLESLETRLGERAVTFGLGERARVRFSGADEMLIDRVKIGVKLQVFGDLSRYNACAAAAAAAALGIKPDVIRQGLESFKSSGMRLERLKHPSGCDIVLDAYNANPASMRASISAFCSEFAGRPKVLVLGDMKELGAGSAEFHRELGQWLASLPLKAVYLAGPEMEKAGAALKSAAPFPVHYGKDAPELKRELKSEFKAGQILLFKASRAMRLEALLEGEGAACSTI